MFGRRFRKAWRGGGYGRGGCYGPGYARADWRMGATPGDWDAEGWWGGPPPWARRWGVDVPPTERKAWLEQAKTHLQSRLDEIEKELQSLTTSDEA
ncbi:MAG TPA: hypothetical protein ENJ54_11050 [Chloroflexi bacterium]|nr:hypothetical protein [Chloroflexota bacterium]